MSSCNLVQREAHVISLVKVSAKESRSHSATFGGSEDTQKNWTIEAAAAALAKLSRVGNTSRLKFQALFINLRLARLRARTRPLFAER